jgi:hypothetical protein
MTPMLRRRRLPLAVLLFSSLRNSQSFSIVSTRCIYKRQNLVAPLLATNEDMKEDVDLKAELSKYLEIRRELRADEEAKA